MFKVPGEPSPKSEVHELADFAELVAFCNGKVSARELVAYLGREDDNDFNEGCDDNEDENAAEMDEVMNEVERRESACNNGYPFKLSHQGMVLETDFNSEKQKHIVYIYLLLSTRLNMKSHKVQADIDGTTLLEEIGARVLQCYLGKERARAMVFGTAMGNKFEDKVDRLCSEINEGGCFKNWDRVPVAANDDKVDSIAWVPFSDRSSNQIVIFGQCKTGTAWRDSLTQLQPEGFLKRWTSERSMSLTPIRAFCVSEAVNRARWEGITSYSGLFLDRCRIVDLCDDLDDALIQKVDSWHKAAMSLVNY